MTAMFNDSQIQKVEELPAFMNTIHVFDIKTQCSQKERAQWIQERLIRFRYFALQKKQKKILRDYLCAITGLKERALKYHITAYKEGRTLCTSSHRRQFPTIYTNADKELLAETDNLHSRLNGHATREICKAMYEAGDKRYARLQNISNGHLYNLRKSRLYREQALTIEKTQPTTVPIGSREKPKPNGEPGFIRVDTVHQGDRDGEKSVYHINLVDEITQWEVMVAVPEISMKHLGPVLKMALEQFPFLLKNFHSDNGSEYINKIVANLLNDLLIKQTKSRPRKSSDNGLVESKNGSIIRKHIGYWFIPKKWAARITVFYRDHLIPYVNFYRPSGFPTTHIDEKGRKTVQYKIYQTPLQKLLSIDTVQQYLKPGITIASLKEECTKKNPNQAAQEMQEAKRELFKMIDDDLCGRME